MPKIDTVEPAPAEVLTPEQIEQKAKDKKAQEDALIKNRLNNKDFLKFLQKNPDAEKSADDSEYLKGRIEIFDKLQIVKKKVKEYIAVEAGMSDFGEAVEGDFVGKLENVAIKAPDDFLVFSTKVAAYLESLERNKSLEAVYQKMASHLKLGDNFSELPDAKKVVVIEDVHARLELLINGNEEELLKTGKTRTIGTHFSTEARAKYKKQISDLSVVVEALKVGQKTLNKEAILAALGEVTAIKKEFEGNQSFGIVFEAYTQVAERKILEAVSSGNDAIIAKYRTMIAKSGDKESQLYGPAFEKIKSTIDKGSRTRLYSGMGAVVEGNEVTLDTFEKGVITMREKGIKLGLSSSECNVLIATALENKITTFERKPDEGQNRVKIILAKRILANLK